MNTSEFLAQLEHVKKSGKGWSARCPAHDDQHNSLSVSNGAGKILVNCHAGCTHETICSALGIEVDELFDRSERSLPSPEITYDYTDEQGTLLYQVVRKLPKQFRQRRPDGSGDWIWNLDGVRRVLYRLPHVLSVIKEGGTIVVVEGEKDVGRLVSHGVDGATTNPGGVDKWRPEYTRVLADANVVLIPDNDAPGLAHMREVAASLLGVATSVRLVALPDVSSKGDVSDWLDAGYTVDELEGLIRRTPEWNAKPEDAEPAPVERTMRELMDDPQLAEGREVVVPHLVWRGRVSLMAAREKVGKSTLASAGCATASRGLQFLREESAEGCVVWIALEEHLSDLVERLEDFNADPDRVYIIDNLGRDALKTLRDVIKRRKPALVVIDTLAALVDVLGSRPDSGDSTAWTTIMRKITELTRAMNVGMLLLHHGTKTTGDYRDSSAIGANVDMIISLREKDGLRTLHGKGRWREPERTLRLLDAKWEIGNVDEILVDAAHYDLVSGELSLEARIMEYVKANEGASTNEITTAIKGRRKTISGCLDRLVERGKLVKIARANRSYAFFSGTHLAERSDDVEKRRDAPTDATEPPGTTAPDAPPNGASQGASQPGSYRPKDPDAPDAEDYKHTFFGSESPGEKHTFTARCEWCEGELEAVDPPGGPCRKCRREIS